MPSYPARALVLRKTKLGETDTIVTLLASDGRQVRAVAKGLRKPGGRFGARLEPFAVADLLLHTGRSLDVITEARTVATHARAPGRLRPVRSGGGRCRPARQDLRRRPGRAAAVRYGHDDARRDGAGAPRRASGTRGGVLGQGHGDARLPPAARVLCVLRRGVARESRASRWHRVAPCVPSAARLDASAVRFSAEGRAWLDRLLRARMAEIPEHGHACRCCRRLLRPDAGVRRPTICRHV